ncbi:MAG TPA: hypothetical protein VGM37_19605 [Armatimonadota bacterium]|jgi:hypothetical protein
MKDLCFLLLVIVSLTAAAAKTPAPPFTQPLGYGPHWSVRNGLTLALHDAKVSGEPGGVPRGLIRIVYRLAPGPGGLRSLNFIAVEPCVVGDRRDFSELQRSPSDGKPGIKFWFGPVKRAKDTLRQTIRMEKFANGAHPYLIAELRADRPLEVRFEVYAEPDSAPMSMCILTATMGNFQRLRRLHLKDRVATVRDALPQDPGADFTAHAVFPLSELKSDADGVVVSADGDEENARLLSQQITTGPWWRYEGPNLTQYWRQPKPVDRDLRVLVNARKTYYGGVAPIPGGMAFENFEMNAAFHPGQAFVFGIKPAPKG